MADEIVKQETQPTAQAQNTTTSSTTTTTGIAAQNETMRNQINTLHDSSINAQKAQLKTAFDQNMSDLNANREKIDPRYQQSMNQTENDYQRNRRNNNMQAAANGLNTGAGSQMQLAQNNTYQNRLGELQKAKNEEFAAADKAKLDLNTKYQNDIASAVANNEVQRAGDMLKQYQVEQQQIMQQAQMLAEYGDFSGFATLYGDGAAKNMERMWAMQNPSIAYTQGKLTADEYFKLTGSYPPGYDAGGGGGGYGGYYGGGYGGSYTGDNGNSTGSSGITGSGANALAALGVNIAQNNAISRAAVSSGSLGNSSSGRTPLPTPTGGTHRIS